MSCGDAEDCKVELDAAQQSYDAAKREADSAQDRLYDTDHLESEAEQAWLNAQNTGDPRESERAWKEYQKAKGDARDALDRKSEADREVEEAGRRLDAARNAYNDAVWHS